jgi:hypothetical protein
MWWNTTLPQCNGIRFFNDTARRTIHLFTDACNMGMGGFYYESTSNTWLTEVPHIPPHQSFATAVDKEHINILEVRAIQYAMNQWARH